VTIGEIELGIARQQVLNPGFAQELTEWLDVTLRAYGRKSPISSYGAWR
jgi:hypothetical protein